MLNQLLDILFPPRGRRKVARELSLADVPTAVQSTLTRSGVSVNTCAPYAQASVGALVHALKFDASPHAHALCTQILSDVLLEHVSERTAFGNHVILTTIPASITRRTARGHDHLAPLARSVCERIGATYAPLLARTRDTKRQMGLHASERLRNMHNAFTCTHDEPNQNIHIIVLDDVVTTGSTLQEAARALRKAGYHSVSLWAIAHA